MSEPERFQPHAARAMASMFDDVSGRYDLLNRVMTLGQDGAWREAMWRRVPGDGARRARPVHGQRRLAARTAPPAGRLVLGIDVSLAMLEVARDTHGGPGWAPPRGVRGRVPAAAARRIALDAVTVAFGVRNLRPRRAALAEIARVLRAGRNARGARGRRPCAGTACTARTRSGCGTSSRSRAGSRRTLRAYRYLSESIFEFGAGPEFERDLAAAGLEIDSPRVASCSGRRGCGWPGARGDVGQNPADARKPLQLQSRTGGVRRQKRARFRGRAADAAPGGRRRPSPSPLTLAIAMLWALGAWIKVNDDLPLSTARSASSDGC